MSADMYVEDPAKPLSVEVRCYVCSRVIVLYGPPAGQDHEACMQKRRGRLPVSVEWENAAE